MLSSKSPFNLILTPYAFVISKFGECIHNALKVKIETSLGNFALLLQPRCPPETNVQASANQAILTPPSSPALISRAKLPLPSFRREESKHYPATYAAVVKGLKGHQDILQHSSMCDARCAEVAIPAEHDDFPLPDQSIAETTQLQLRKDQAGGKSFDCGFASEDQTPRSCKRRSSSHLAGGVAFSTSFTRAKLSGQFIDCERGLRDVAFWYVGHTSMEEFFASSVSEPGDAHHFEQRFQPQNRKAQGWIESSCDYTIC